MAFYLRITDNSVMKQLVQSLKTGTIALIEAPCAQVKTNGVLIQTSHTLISAGTERMLLEFGRAGIIGKIKQQPDKVKQVLEKVKTDGLLTTLDAVKSKLDQPIPLGYCNVGTVLEIGKNVSGFSKGDRVISNGNHAEVVSIGKNLCAKIPNAVSDEEATFTVLASIGLQGIRLTNPLMGETIAVIGLGLIGLMTVQMLKANGCRVIGLDFNPERLELAKQFGAEIIDLSKTDDPQVIVDAALITAATDSNDPVRQAAHMCRKRGRIVLVGVTGLELSRADFYEKELSFQVSCSYGPGRYDPAYEEQGQDYPVGLVRFTEQRNFETVLQLMAEGSLNVKPLITHTFDFVDAAKAYDALEKDKAALGIILRYAQTPQKLLDRSITLSPNPIASSECTLNLVGAGNYASRVLIPAFAKQKVSFNKICSGGGLSASLQGRKFGFSEASTDLNATINDPLANIIAIVTRHNQHASQTLQALKAGKHVFVEKPLVITQAELDELKSCWNELADHPILMVGFNRRFAPHIQKAKDLLSGINSSKSFIMTVNAGSIPKEHWTQDPQVGGGRLIGEACHFVDLLRFLAGSPITQSSVYAIQQQDDQVSIQLGFADGSIGTIHYFANGHKAFPKERLEIFAEGKVLIVDNFRKMRGFGFKNFKKMNLWRQNKGQEACVAAFLKGIKEGQYPIPIDELFEVHATCLDLRNQVRN